VHFEGREIKPYAEPVDPRGLEPGQVYLMVTFLDEELLLPEMLPLAFRAQATIEQVFSQSRSAVCFPLRSILPPNVLDQLQAKAARPLLFSLQRA